MKEVLERFNQSQERTLAILDNIIKLLKVFHEELMNINEGVEDENW